LQRLELGRWLVGSCFVVVIVLAFGFGNFLLLLVVFCCFVVLWCFFFKGKNHENEYYSCYLLRFLIDQKSGFCFRLVSSRKIYSLP